MSAQLSDLPNELLLNIFSYITNIREKIRLASVNSTFYNLVTEACRTQNYKLINHSDYMYESEYKKVENTQKIINLHELLRIAPRLTHFVDKIHHFGYDIDSDSNLQNRKPLSLIHTKYICLDLSKSHFFGRTYETTDGTAEIILSNLPVVTTLDIRVDNEYNLQFPLMNNLKVFKFSYYASPKIFEEFHPFPSRIIDRINIAAPNLEEIHFSSKYVIVNPDLPDVLIKLSTNCPNLRAIKIFIQFSDEGQGIISDFKPFRDDHKLLKLEYLDLRGIYIVLDSWEKLLSLTPNLKFLSFDPSTEPQVESIITKKCPKARYDLERPYEIEEEYRIYCQRTYGFDKDRYL